MLLGNAMMHTTKLRIKYEIVNMISIHRKNISSFNIEKYNHTHTRTCVFKLREVRQNTHSPSSSNIEIPPLDISTISFSTFNFCANRSFCIFFS